MEEMLGWCWGRSLVGRMGKTGVGWKVGWLGYLMVV